jgi:hypothetical protein
VVLPQGRLQIPGPATQEYHGRFGTWSLASPCKQFGNLELLLDLSGAFRRLTACG